MLFKYLSSSVVPVHIHNSKETNKLMDQLTDGEQTFKLLEGGSNSRSSFVQIRL